MVKAEVRNIQFFIEHALDNHFKQSQIKIIEGIEDFLKKKKEKLLQVKKEEENVKR